MQEVQRAGRFLPAWRPIEVPAEVGSDPRSAVPVVVGAVIVPMVRFVLELPLVLVRGRR